MARRQINTRASNLLAFIWKENSELWTSAIWREFSNLTQFTYCEKIEDFFCVEEIICHWKLKMAFFLDYEPQYQRPCPRRRLLDQHFGLGLTPDDYLAILALPTPQPQANNYYRPWRNLQAVARDIGSTIKEDKNKFQVNLDVQHFAPEEISVKTVDGFIVIEAKHEEKRDDHGYISRSFSRRYPLPEGIEADMVTSRLSSDGVLSITAPLKAPPKASNERVVPIVQTGPVKKQSDSELVEEKEKS